jgi:hypothetical protein
VGLWIVVRAFTFFFEFLMTNLALASG